MGFISKIIYLVCELIFGAVFAVVGALATVAVFTAGILITAIITVVVAVFQSKKK